MVREFDARNANRACEHQFGDLIARRIGNIALAAFVRSLLSPFPDRFPVTLGRVVCNGTHAGDHLTVNEVEKMLRELDHLNSIQLEDAEEELVLGRFEQTMRELAERSLQVRKPLVF